MNSYCLLCKKDTENINPKIVRTKNNRIMMLFPIIKSLDLRQDLVLQNVFHKDLVCSIV